MKETKFRAWNINENIMHDIAYPAWNGLIEVWKDNIPQSEIQYLSMYGPEDQGVLMQYTGLKDKNGVEIYEGDIVTNTTYVRLHSKGLLNPELEKYCKPPDFLVVIHDIRLLPFKELQKVDDIKVVGNIYENPELLKED